MPLAIAAATAAKTKIIIAACADTPADIPFGTAEQFIASSKVCDIAIPDPDIEP